MPHLWKRPSVNATHNWNWKKIHNRPWRMGPRIKVIATTCRRLMIILMMMICRYIVTLPVTPLEMSWHRSVAKRMACSNLVTTVDAFWVRHKLSKLWYMWWLCYCSYFCYWYTFLDPSGWVSWRWLLFGFWRYNPTYVTNSSVVNVSIASPLYLVCSV